MKKGNQNKKGKAVLTSPVRVTGRKYIAGDMWRYEWKPSVVREFISHFIELKETGSDAAETILTLSHRFRRNEAEVAILIMDLAERGFISSAGRGSNILGFTLAAVYQDRNSDCPL